MCDGIIDTLKYFALNFLWVFIGFSFGLAVYWLRLGQFMNEVKSLINLFFKRYDKDKVFCVKVGVDLKPLDGGLHLRTVRQGSNEMIFGYEKGVDWIFKNTEWKLIRSRIIYASFKEDHKEGKIPSYYIVSHFDILT
jgi:hypothetical protein